MNKISHALSAFFPSLNGFRNFSLSSENRPVQPKLSTKMKLKVGNQIYDLTAIIYHHSAHFWCKKLVTSTGYKQGWYLYNGMWNNGQAIYVGKHPQVDTPAYMHILLSEKCLHQTHKKRKQHLLTYMLHVQGSPSKKAKV